MPLQTLVLKLTKEFNQVDERCPNSPPTGAFGADAALPNNPVFGCAGGVLLAGEKEKSVPDGVPDPRSGVFAAEVA
jgi:hypothetical protein